MNNFLEQLLHMANTHNQKQLNLYMEMHKELRKFNKSYNSIYDEKLHEYKKINNYYKMEFIDFDEHLVPFDNSGEGKFPGKLTLKTPTRRPF